jgi:hypothetical protein
MFLQLNVSEAYVRLEYMVVAAHAIIASIVVYLLSKQ